MTQNMGYNILESDSSDIFRNTNIKGIASKF